MLVALLSALLLDRLHNFSGLAQGLIDFFQSDGSLGMRSIATFVLIEPSPEMLEIHRSGSCCERKFVKEAIFLPLNIFRIAKYFEASSSARVARIPWG